MMDEIGRNNPCWCGSGLKYKKCHAQIEDRMTSYALKGYKVPPRHLLKSIPQIHGIRESGRINTAILDYIGDFVKSGINTEEINRLIHEKTIELGGTPAQLNFNGYPKSVCVSVNDVVCHGIPSDKVVLKDGDIVNIDVSTLYNGFYSDSSRMFCVGAVSPEKERLVQTTKECVELGIKAVKPWGFLGDIGHVINEHAKHKGYSVVRELGGHGIGLQLHEEPWVGHVGRAKTGMLLVPGLIFTIEPALNVGSAKVYTSKQDGWTMYTADQKPSAQCESMVLVTNEGCEVLAW